MATMHTLARLAPLAHELEALANRLRPSVVGIRDSSRGAGSGVVWSEGVIITNSHVAHRDAAEVVHADGSRSAARVFARDPENDLAALRVDGARSPALIGDARTLRVGELVLAIGHPLGVEHAVTAGIVSGLPRADGQPPRELLRSDLHLNPGNSGGPLVDAEGRVVGVNAMVAGPGTALSIPSHTVVSFLSWAEGTAPYLGVEVIGVALPNAYQRVLGRPLATGLLVTGVQPGSPAERAGLFPGDVIVSAGHRDLWAPHRLRDEIALAGSGSELPLRVIRGGRLHQVVSRLETRV